MLNLKNMSFLTCKVPFLCFSNSSASILTYSPLFKYSSGFQDPADSKYYLEEIGSKHDGLSVKLEKYLRDKFNLGFSKPQILLRKKKIRVQPKGSETFVYQFDYELKEGDTIHYKKIECKHLIKPHMEGNSRSQRARSVPKTGNQPVI